MRKIILFFIIFVTIISLTFAGVYIEQKQERSSSMGNTTSITKIWFNPSMLRTDTMGRITVVNYKDGTVLLVNKKNKTYSILDLAKFKQMTAMVINMLKQFSKDKNLGISIKITGEKKVIDGYKCYKVITNIYGMKSEDWLSKDIDIPRALLEKSYEMLLPEEDFKKLVSDPQFKKMRGFPVESIQTANLMGQSSITKTKLIKYKKMPIPDSVFKIDLTGYQKKAINMMGGK